MARIMRNLKSTSGALLALTVSLIAIFFILNFVSQRGWGPLSTAAGWAEIHANGTAYTPRATVSGVPAANAAFNSMGPAL